MQSPKTKQICGMPEHRLRFEYHDYLQQLVKDQTAGEMHPGSLERWRPVPALGITSNIDDTIWHQMWDYINGRP